MSRAVVNNNSSPLLVTRPNRRMVSVVGRRGADGATPAVFTRIAGEAVGGHRVLVYDAVGRVVYADSSEASHAGRVVGLSLGAAAEGEAVTVRRLGEVTEPSWSWTPGAPLFLGTDGLITETPPATGIVQSIGSAVTATTILLDFSLFILRG